MKYVRSFFLSFAFASATFAAGAPDAHACTTFAEPPVSLPAINGNVPVDGPIGFATSAVAGFRFRVEVTHQDGTAVPVVNEPSPDPKIRWIRPTSGTFPEGRLTVKVRDEDDDEVEGSVTVSGTVADYRLRIDEPTLTSRIEPDDTSPKIKCGRGGGEDSCGPIEDTDLASRWRRAPVMAFHDHDLGWVKTLFAASHRWSVRHADGTVETETTTKSEHVFESIGVEYCVEATRTPLPGVPGSTQTERLCIQDDGSAFAWSDAENEAQIVSTSKSWRCETLDFPNGASVPDELEDEASGGAGQGGCSVGTRYGCGAWSSVVGVALAVLARRRRSSEAASRRHSRFGSGVVASSRWRRRRSATST